MRWIGFTLALALFSATTGGALLAAVQGWGLPGLLDKPVSVRHQSVRGGGYRRHGGAAFIYFGSRRHYGGGYRHGK